MATVTLFGGLGVGARLSEFQILEYIDKDKIL